MTWLAFDGVKVQGRRGRARPRVDGAGDAAAAGGAGAAPRRLEPRGGARGHAHAGRVHPALPQAAHRGPLPRRFRFRLLTN